jgi:hypothetical protein
MMFEDWSMNINAYHFVAASNEDGDGSGVLALFNHQHALLRGAELHLTNDSSVAQLFSADFLKPRHNSSTSGNSDKLKF